MCDCRFAVLVARAKDARRGSSRNRTRSFSIASARSIDQTPDARDDLLADCSSMSSNSAQQLEVEHSQGSSGLTNDIISVQLAEAQLLIWRCVTTLELCGRRGVDCEVLAFMRSAGFRLSSRTCRVAAPRRAVVEDIPLCPREELAP